MEMKNAGEKTLFPLNMRKKISTSPLYVQMPKFSSQCFSGSGKCTFMSVRPSVRRSGGVNTQHFKSHRKGFLRTSYRKVLFFLRCSLCFSNYFSVLFCVFSKTLYCPLILQVSSVSCYSNILVTTQLFNVNHPAVLWNIQ